MKTDIIISELKKGDKLYSTIHGNVIFVKICENDKKYPIEVIDKYNIKIYFTKEGKYYAHNDNATLFKKNPFIEIDSKSSPLITSSFVAEVDNIVVKYNNGEIDSHDFIAQVWSKLMLINQPKAPNKVLEINK